MTEAISSEELNFLANPAPSITHMELDIIKLTAQFISEYGSTFLMSLLDKEQNNPQFDFLKPQHGQYKYMVSLIMQYSLVKNYPLDILEVLKVDATDRNQVFERIKKRAETERILENERQEQEEEQKRDQLLFSQIDWHDFVIVESVDYEPDDTGHYPPPTTADQVGTRYLMQQRADGNIGPQEMDLESDDEQSD